MKETASLFVANCPPLIRNNTDRQESKGFRAGPPAFAAFASERATRTQDFFQWLFNFSACACVYAFVLACFPSVLLPMAQWPFATTAARTVNPTLPTGSAMTEVLGVSITTAFLAQTALIVVRGWPFLRQHHHRLIRTGHLRHRALSSNGCRIGSFTFLSSTGGSR